MNYLRGLWTVLAVNTNLLTKLRINFSLTCLLFFFTYIFLFVNVGFVNAGTYYINSSTGNDTSGNGTELQPWATLGKAHTSVPTGENNTVYIASGIYDRESTVKAQSMLAGFTTTYQAQGAVTVRVYDHTINSGTGAILYANGAGSYVFKGASTGLTKNFIIDLHNTGDGGSGNYSFIIGTSGSAHITLEDVDVGNSSQVGYPAASGVFTCRRCYIHDFTSSNGPIRALGSVIIESSFIKNWGSWGNFGSGVTKWVNNTFYGLDTGDNLIISSNVSNPEVTIQNNIFIYGGAAIDTWRPINYALNSDIIWNVSNNLAWKDGTLSSPRDIKNYPILYNQYFRENITNNLYVVDPLMVDPANTPELHETSLAIGRGVNTGILTDYAGQSYTSGRFDIGAWSVGDSASKQYVSVTNKKGLIVGDSFCDSHSFSGDDFDEALKAQTYFNDWSFVNLPGTTDSVCFTGRRLSEMAGPIGEFIQSGNPSALFVVAGFNDRGAGGQAPWSVNQIETYEQIAQDLTNNLINFMYVAQPDHGCTPTTTIADGIEDNSTFKVAFNVRRFKTDNIWSSYYNCPTDSTHPNDIGYNKMAEYATEAYAYDYDTPYQANANRPDRDGNVRVFGTGKFRNTNTPSGNTINLHVIPSSNDRFQYVDINVSQWLLTGARTREWTESSNNITGTVEHTIGDLEPNEQYILKVDGAQGSNISGPDCSSGLCTANGSGEIAFTYTGGYSTHTFSLTEYVAPTPTSVQSSSSSSTSSSSPTVPGCSDRAPAGTPDLFQIDRTGKQAKLIFTPVNDPVQSYNIIFGHYDGDERFGGISMQAQNENKGVQSIIIDHLDPKANYSFKVISTNGCATGEWSNWLSTGRLQGKTSIFYRYWDKVRNIF